MHFDITLNDNNINIFLFLICSYVVGHFIDPAFKKCAKIARKENKGKLLKLLTGPSEHDWRKFYISGSTPDSGIPGLVDGNGLAQAINDVIGSKDKADNLSTCSDTFYTCWRLLEAEVPDGLRYHHRTMAFYNFAASMTFALILSSFFLCWYTYQLSCQFFTEHSLWLHLPLSLIIFIIVLYFASVFFRDYTKYRKEWVQNVYRLFWVWYNIHYRKTKSDKEKVDIAKMAEFRLILID